MKPDTLLRPIVHGIIRVAALLMLAACVRMSNQMERWVGTHDTDLVSSWGAPERQTMLSDGSRVLTWTRSWSDEAGSHRTCEQSFTITPAGIVSKYALVGCPKYAQR